MMGVFYPRKLQGHFAGPWQRAPQAGLVSPRGREGEARRQRHVAGPPGLEAQLPVLATLPARQVRALILQPVRSKGTSRRGVGPPERGSRRSSGVGGRL